MTADRATAFALAVFLAWGASVHAGTDDYAGHTLEPLTYIRDYRPGHLDDEGSVAAIEANTPDLLVLGKDAPLHHNWGPVRGTGGENQAFGRGEHIVRILPDELKRKMARIRAMVDRLHRAGVRWVMPYICTMTIGGHHKRRTGFWEFYDHWDDYKAFGLGPRPADDPCQWMQRKPDGSPRTYYQWEAPYYAPNCRWAACIHHAGWRQHLANVVRLAAEVGYDGVYMDNNRSTRCYCPRCQARFRDYVAKRFHKEELKRHLGVESHEKLEMAAEPGTLLWRLTAEFWTDSKIEFLKWLKAVGERAGGEFHIFANPGAWMSGSQEVARLAQVATFIQSEENGDAYGAHPGLVRQKIAGPLHYAHINRRMLEYKFTQSLCSPLRVTMTTRTMGAQGHRSRRSVDMNPQTAALAIAEAAAYGGGGAFNMNLRWDTHRETKRWRAFLKAHRALYEGLEAYAPIGMLAFGEQHYFNDDRVQKMGLRWLAWELAAERVLFGLVHEVHCTPARLARYRVVVVPPGVRYVSAAQLAALEAFAQSGGKLLVIGDDFARFDELCRPRPPRAVDGVATVLAMPCDMRTLRMALDQALGFPADLCHGSDAEGIGVNAFARPTEIIVHLVNYNVPLGRKSTEKAVPVEGLKLAVPLPANWRVKRVIAFGPDEPKGMQLKWKTTPKGATIDLAALPLYRAIRIEGEGAR